MKRSTASLFFGGLLVLSLGLKVAAFSRTEATEVENDQIQTYLKSHGFSVTNPDPQAAPAWVTGIRDTCRVRIADVPPEGWARKLIDQQVGADRVLYAFDGRFYRAQPVWRTRMEKYRRRLIRYFGMQPAELAVRAVDISPGCPDGSFSAADAAYLSN